MYPLRFARLWLTLGWLLIALIVFLSLWSKPPELGIEQGDKFAHVIAYATLMLWFANIYPKKSDRIWLSLAFFAMGICLELLQGVSEFRRFSYADILANGFGVLLGLCLSNTGLSNSLLHLDKWLLRFS